ncbi:Kinesin motor domain family protein [Leishmania donovani]|uniref:Kinesin motor domain family protein n=1 Tax=Leishmania donovani TaxID=5661 RepID=A0A504X4X9_LEIDO|nr:Kinesin motor domain family protein [Leishmania donovani]
MYSGCTAARQTHLLSPTLPQSSRNGSVATDPPSTVFVSPRTSSMHRSPLASFEEAQEGDGERAPHNSRYASSTNGPRSSTFIHSVSAYLSTATGKRGASSAATTVRASLANGSSITGNSASKPRQSRHQPSLIIASGCTSKRLATYTATATTTRCGTLAPGVHEDSYTKLESPKGRMPESDLNDANEGVDWACVNVGLGDLVLESMQLARASAAAPQADSVASTSAGNAGQDKNAGGDSGSMALPPQGRTSPAPEDGIATEPAVMVADDDVANADMNILVAVRVRPRTSLITAKGAPSTSPLTDTAARRLFPASSASSHSAEQQPPCELRSSGGDWDDALSTQASTAGGGSLVEERQRTTNSTPSHSATVRVRRSASRRAILKAEKNDTGNSDSKGSASKEVCVSADARNGFIDCAVAVAANASGGASTPAANGAAAGQRIRTLRFRFDCILDDSVTQADIMACIGQRAVARVLRGYHSTVMCYGQTGSGKTYTIAGPHGGKLSRKALRWLASQPASAGAVECDDSNVDEEEQVRVASDVGLLPRILIQLFRGLEARHGADGRLQQASAAPTSSWQVTLSALELYNNNMRDLLPGELPKNEAATLGKKDVSRPSAATRLRHHGNSSSMSGRRDHRKATASARVSSRCGNSATTRAPPTAAASTPRANSHAGASTAMGSAKTMPMKWTAPTTTKAAPQLQIRLGAPASSASQSSPPTKLKKARAVSPPPSSWASLRQPAHNAGSEAVYIEGLREHQQYERRSRDGEKPAWATRRSTLSLVDLAGSERVSHTGAHGLQLKEAQNINRSLSVLGNVMRLLSSASRSSLSKNLATTSASSAAALTGARADQHIPYRDSKLTHILQSSLGGNAITFLLCNVSPDSRDAQETMSTLRFAKLCKSVKSNARLNETTADTEDAQAAAEAKICQLAVDASTAQNRLQQLATAVTSSSRARDSSGGRGLVVPEETTAPKVISGERSAGAGNGGMQRCDSLESSGVENKEVADSGARRMELQRKLIAAAAAAITIEDAAMLSMLYSTDAAVGEAEATARDRVIDGTNPLEVSSTASTASTRTRDGGSGVLVSKPTAIPVSMGVSSASEETRAPTRHPRSSPPEHAPALQPSPSMAAFSSVPLPSLTANQKQPRLECPMNAIDTTLAEERAARAATQARLVEVEQSNLLLRLRLAELHGRMRLEGGSTHFAEVHQVMNAEKATRRTVGKDYSWAPSSLATAPAPLPSPAEASASRVLWPPHYSRASHDASLKGKAHQKPQWTRGDEGDTEAMQDLPERCDEDGTARMARAAFGVIATATRALPAMDHPHLALALVIVRASRKSEDSSPSEDMKDFSMEEEEEGGSARAPPSIAVLVMVRGHYQRQTRPAATSPSPPMSTCRRLSYDSSKTGSNSRSRTRASLSSVASPHSFSHTLSEEHQQHHFWQRCVTVTEVATVTASRRSAVAAARSGVVVVANACAKRDDSSLVAEARSPSIRIGPAVLPSSLETTASSSVVDAHAQVTSKPGGAAGAGEQQSHKAAAAAVTAAVAAATSQQDDDGRWRQRFAALDHGRSSSRSSRRHEAWNSCTRERAIVAVHVVALVRCRLSSSSSTSAPVDTPPQRWDDYSRYQHSVHFQPAPTLRNVGIGGPSPFAAEQLAMPRRPQPRLAVAPTGDGASVAGCAQSGQTNAKVAAPPLQLVRPADLYRGATTATGTATAGVGGPASTAMAASLLPGAAAAQDRLQLPRRSRLARTPSATSVQQRRRTPSAGSFGGGGSARKAGSVASSSPLKRRTSVSSHSDDAVGPVGGSAARVASRRPRSSTPSGTLSVYTTRGASGGRSPLGHSEPSRNGGGAPALVVAGSGTDTGTAAPRRSVVRSGSAPVHQRRRESSSSRTSSAVPGSVTDQAPRVADRLRVPAVAPSSLVRYSSVASVHQRRSHATITTIPVSNAAAAASTSVAEWTSSMSTSSAPRRSHSRDGTSGTARSSAAGKSVRSSLHTAAASAAAKTPNMGTAPTARRPNVGATRPIISSTAGAGGPRARPPRDGGSSNTVSVSQASMISMEESKAFLQDFQRMNDRELALFGTLLATVASEQQNRRGLGITGDATPSADKANATRLVGNAADDREAGIAPPTGVVASAEDVTVWTCKRPALHANEELIVLVRRSRSHSAGLHAPPRSSTSGPEAPPSPKQQQRQKPAKPLLQPDQLTQRADGTEEKGGGHVAASLHAFVRSPLRHPYSQQQARCTVTDAAAGGRGSSGAVVLHRASRSPSPTPPSAAIARGEKENGQQARSLHSASSSPVPASPLSTAAGARVLQQQQQVGALASARADRSSSGKLRPREATDVNTSANRTAAGAARKVAVETIATPARKPHKAPPSSSGAAAAATAGAVGRRAVRNRSSSSAVGRVRGGSRRRCGANDGVHTPSSLQEHQRQLSVESYTDIMRCYSPKRLEGLHDGNGGSGCDATLKEERMSIDEGPRAAGASASSLSSAVSEAAAPLAALKRAKELAAELAAAARARTVSADKPSVAMIPTSFTSPATFSSVDSPTSGSVSMGRASGGYATGAASEISSVRVTAAQLQLLIDSSRSQANYARYQPL